MLFSICEAFRHNERQVGIESFKKKKIQFSNLLIIAIFDTFTFHICSICGENNGIKMFVTRLTQLATSRVNWFLFYKNFFLNN